ncbi:hypothetical protein BJF85_06495 [Saccharomonospora sp. CUA-673]|nr:hypothetical protein BJF85_06495 [Saccharomonospora sp. CUA-673]
MSATAPTDELQIWLARTDDGVTVRLRHPDTAEAAGLVEGLAEAWSAQIEAMAAQARTATAP